MEETVVWVLKVSKIYQLNQADADGRHSHSICGKPPTRLEPMSEMPPRIFYGHYHALARLRRSSLLRSISPLL